jgi:hypothetical protein
MYIASIFNKEQLFQHFSGLVAKSGSPRVDEFNEFLSRATAARLCLARMEVLNSICVGQFQKQKVELLLRDERIVFWSPTLVELLNELSPCVNAIRATQNLILPISVKASGVRTSSTIEFIRCNQRIDRYGLAPKDLLTHQSLLALFGFSLEATIATLTNISAH